MANVQKYTRGKIGGLTRHFEKGRRRLISLVWESKYRKRFAKCMALSR